MSEVSNGSKCFWCRLGTDVKRMIPLVLVAVALAMLISENSKKETKRTKQNHKTSIQKSEARNTQTHSQKNVEDILK